MKLKDSFNAQKACTFLVGYHASIEIEIMLYWKILS